PKEWYGSEEAIRIADKVLLFQRYDGGWPKEWPIKKDYLREYSDSEIERLYDLKYKRDCTFDNGATWTEMRFLGKVANATKNAEYLLAFNHGFDFLIESQYENGGWPQYYPGLERYSPGFSKWSPDGIESFITFNDDAMIGVIWLLKDISEGKSDFSFVGSDRRKRAAEAVRKGIDCILNSQFIYDGKRTAWPSQMDERTFEPRWGRDFEPLSLVSGESVKIVRFLMSLEKPDEAVISAIQGAVQWLVDVKIEGIRIEQTKEPVKIRGHTYRRERYVVEDPNAPPIWARFYELNIFRPIFASRGSEVKY